MSSDVCGISVHELYLKDPGNEQEPAGYILCTEMGDMCESNGCSCRRTSSGTLRGSFEYFGVCVLLQNEADCVASGSDHITCAISTTPDATTELQKEANSSIASTNTTTENNEKPTPSTSPDDSAASPNDVVKAASSSSSSTSINTTVLVVIIAVGVVFVALMMCVLRKYCMRRSKPERKLSSGQNNFDSSSPTNMTDRSSATPSFPAFDARTRSTPSPVVGEHGRMNQDAQWRNGHDANPSRRNPNLNDPFASDGGRREPNSGRGRQVPDIDAQFAPSGPRGLKDAGAPPRGKQATSKSVRSPASGTATSTYDKASQFARLAAFEAPPLPPPRSQKPVQSDKLPKSAKGSLKSTPSSSKRPGFYIDDAPVSSDYDILSPLTTRSLAPSVASSVDTVVASGRKRPTPLQQRRPQYPAATSSYYQTDYKHSDNKYGNDNRYDESRYDESRYDESRYDESKFDESGFKNKFEASSNYSDSFVSEVSSMGWSGASGLSDDSYYHAVPSSMARIPVIEVPNDDDDDDDRSEDGYSEWGHSTQQSANDYRSTGASDASFRSVNSDFKDSTSGFKEREF